jgi:hypothetical protein
MIRSNISPHTKHFMKCSFSSGGLFGFEVRIADNAFVARPRKERNERKTMKTLAALLIALATTAQATVIDFHGTITSIEDTPPIMPQVGNLFRGTLVFDPNRPFREDGGLNVLWTFTLPVLGIFHTSLEPVYSFGLEGFRPSIAGEYYRGGQCKRRRLEWLEVVA